MKAQSPFHRFIASAVIAVSLVIVSSITFAQSPAPANAAKMADEARAKAALAEREALKANAPVSTSYDLDIKDGRLVWNGAKRKDGASAVPASLPNVIDLLRDQHPEANFVISPAVGDVTISDFKLRNATVNEKLEAIRIASGRQFTFEESKLAGDAGHSLFVLSETPARADARLQVEAFNISGYLDGLGDKENKDERQRLIDQKMAEIEKMVYETVDQYRQISAELNRSGSTSFHMPSIKFHSGANLVIIIGEPEAVAVAAKVIGALPRAQRSVASVFPGDYTSALRQYDQVLNSVNSLFRSSSPDENGNPFEVTDSLNLKVFSLKYASPANVQASVQAVLADKRSKAIADVRSNSLVVTATAQELRTAEKLIQQLDVPDKKPGGETSPPPANSRRY